MRADRNDMAVRVTVEGPFGRDSERNVMFGGNLRHSGEDRRGGLGGLEGDSPGQTIHRILAGSADESVSPIPPEKRGWSLARDKSVLAPLPTVEGDRH